MILWVTFSAKAADCVILLSLQGQDLAKSLAQHGIDTTLITDSAVFAIMSRVNKVRMLTTDPLNLVGDLFSAGRNRFLCISFTLFSGLRV